MGYNLQPRNKKLDVFQVGAFSWSWMLEAGVGLVIGTGPAMKMGKYSFIADSKGHDPRKNDGFRVTAEQAKAMSLVAFGLARVNRSINSEWDNLSSKEKEQIEADLSAIPRAENWYKSAIREDFIETAEAFAAWAKDSGGFCIL